MAFQVGDKVRITIDDPTLHGKMATIVRMTQVDYYDILIDGMQSSRPDHTYSGNVYCFVLYMECSLFPVMT